MIATKTLKNKRAASYWVQSLLSDGYRVMFVSKSYIKLRHSNGKFASIAVTDNVCTLKIDGKVKKVCQY